MARGRVRQGRAAAGTGAGARRGRERVQGFFSQPPRTHSFFSSSFVGFFSREPRPSPHHGCLRGALPGMRAACVEGDPLRSVPRDACPSVRPPAGRSEGEEMRGRRAGRRRWRRGLLSRTRARGVRGQLLRLVNPPGLAPVCAPLLGRVARHGDFSQPPRRAGRVPSLREREKNAHAVGRSGESRARPGGHARLLWANLARPLPAGRTLIHALRAR